MNDMACMHQAVSILEIVARGARQALEERGAGLEERDRRSCARGHWRKRK